MLFKWENNSEKLKIVSGKLQIIRGKYQSSGEFQNNAIKNIKQISLSHVIKCLNLKLMSLRYIKVRYHKMSGSKTLLSIYNCNSFISNVDMNTSSTCQTEYIFPWDFQTVTDMLLRVLPNCISNLINRLLHKICKNTGFHWPTV